MVIYSDTLRRSDITPTHGLVIELDIVTEISGFIEFKMFQWSIFESIDIPTWDAFTPVET